MSYPDPDDYKTDPLAWMNLPLWARVLVRLFVVLVIFFFLFAISPLQAYANSGGGQSGRISDIPYSPRYSDKLYMIFRMPPDERVVLIAGPLSYDEKECNRRKLDMSLEMIEKDMDTELPGVTLSCEWHSKRPELGDT